MFYSHEILASPQYGVATVWLVATPGANTNNRKLTRKAIESVNVPRACDTIEKPPGAPIALRLQGSLLYGVSGVYQKHSLYLLDDAEKMWQHMRTFYRSLQQSASNEIDPKAGNAKRTQITLLDDPKFVPDFSLPLLDFDEKGELLLPGLDPTTQGKMSSQFSPLDLSASASGSSRSPAAPFINLNIRHSSSQRSLGIASPFSKQHHNPGDDDFPVAFGEEELPFADFGLVIDADGNLVEQLEPELPPFPVIAVDEVGEPGQKDLGIDHLPEDEGMLDLGMEDVQMDVKEAMPKAAGQAKRNVQGKRVSAVRNSSEAEDQPQRRLRKIKQLAPDTATHVSREDFKGWSENYLAHVEEARNMSHPVSTVQARKNAYNFVFGTGLGGIGVLNNIPGVEHPLAQFFAGDELKSMIMGDGEAEEAEEAEEGGRRRRSAAVAFGEGEQGRRVRARMDEEPEAQPNPLGRSDPIDDAMMFGNDQQPEVGREQPGSALSDHRRSSNAPWNRPSSVVPSSVRSQKHGLHLGQDSPLVGRGSILPGSDIARFSDAGMPMPGSDGAYAPLDDERQHSSLSEFGAAAGLTMQEVHTSQFMREALDREGRNFLSFVERVAAERGEDDEMGESRRWVEFDGMFDQEDKTKPVVAQAFLHVLALATKGQIKIKQDGAEEKVPFGEIRIGVDGHSAFGGLGGQFRIEGVDENEAEKMEGVEE